MELAFSLRHVLVDQLHDGNRKHLRPEQTQVLRCYGVGVQAVDLG